MATYKVIQDIEAEDKLVGPLTLRQFIYAGIVITLGFINFQLYKVNPLLIIPLLLPMIFFGALAAPIGQDQPSEVWLLAKIRFFLKPRRRIWNQDGISELVTITVPKKVETALTDGLSQTEVRSRLTALASTLDSRGWAVKNVNVNLYGQAGYLNQDVEGDSDRLIGASSLPQDVPIADVTASDDMMDEAVNPTAQNLNRMMLQSEQVHKQQIAQKLAEAAKAPPAKDNKQPNADYWFMNESEHLPPAQPGMAVFDHNPLFAPGVQAPAVSKKDTLPQTPEEAALLNKLHKEKIPKSQAYGHMKTILPLGSQPAEPPKTAKPAATKTEEPKPKAVAPKPSNPDIIRLANNDDLNIATIAREAKRGLSDGDEVVISLH